MLSYLLTSVLARTIVSGQDKKSNTIEFFLTTRLSNSAVTSLRKEHSAKLSTLAVISSAICLRVLKALKLYLSNNDFVARRGSSDVSDVTIFNDRGNIFCYYAPQNCPMINSLKLCRAFITFDVSSIPGDV